MYLNSPPYYAFLFDNIKFVGILIRDSQDNINISVRSLFAPQSTDLLFVLYFHWNTEIQILLSLETFADNITNPPILLLR